MHQKFSILLASLAIAFNVQFASAQSVSCSTDSTIVIYTSDCQGQPNQCSYSVVTDHYNLNNGTLNGSLNWERNDTVLTSLGAIAEIRTLRGSQQGWQNSRSEIRAYTSSAQLSDQYFRHWNGTDWDTVGWTNLAYDASGRLIQRAEYTNSGGVWSNIRKDEYGYTTDNPLWHISSSGASVSWRPELRFEYSYNGNVRSQLEVERWNDSTATWELVDAAAFQPMNGTWSARIHSIRQSVINGIPFSEVYDDYDTLDRSVHHYEFQVTLTGSDPAAESHEEFLTDIEGMLQPAQTICIDQYTLWNGAWVPLINCCTNTYRYTSAGKLSEHLIECGEGGRGSTVYQYDDSGRLMSETFHANNHSEQITRDYHVDYRYPDPERIELFTAPQPVFPVPCRGTTVRPLIGITGGCDGKHFRWEPSRGLSSDTVLTPDILIEDSVTYHLTVNDEAGHQASITLTVGPVDVRPEIEDISGCPERIILHALAGNSPGAFTWYQNGAPVYTGEFFEVTQPGSYQVAHSRWEHITNYDLTENCLSRSEPIVIGAVPSAVKTEHFVEICYGESYLLPDGTEPDQSGDYHTVIQTAAGCDSAVTVHLTLLPELSPTILQNGNVLFTPDPGEYYVWYLDGQPLAAGEEEHSFAAEEEGTYYVLVIDSNGCEGISPAYFLTISDLDEALDEHPFILYPNPAVSKLHILFHREPDSPTYFSLYDISGKCVRERILLERANPVDISDLGGGSYLAVLKNGEQVFRRTVSIAH
ncbi:MAG: hypothetical protein RL021_567 [Bacteroidota bacterium]